MTKDNHRKYGTRDILTRALLIVACVVVVTLLLPREKRFGYDFKAGKPWTHPQIIADYDFPIYKSDEALQAERDSVEKLFQPYFSEDKSVRTTQVLRLRHDLMEGSLKGMPRDMARQIMARIDTVYSVGIVKAEDMRAMTDSGVSRIRVISGREARTRKTDEIFSTRSAYGYVLSADSSAAHREQLTQYNLNNYIEANLNFDRSRSAAARRDLMDAITPTYGLVQRGQKIIGQGEIITPQTYDILKSLEKESEVRNLPSRGMRLMIGGQLLLVLVTFSCFFVYIKMYRPEYFCSLRTFIFLLVQVTIFPIATSLLPATPRALIFVLPFSMTGIFMRIFTDTSTAFVAIGSSVLLGSLAIADPQQFLLVNFAASTAAIFTLHDLQQRSQLFPTALIATLTALFTAMAYDLAQGMTLTDLNPQLYIYITISGVLLLFSYPLLYIVEKAFGFVSSVTLIELSNINTPLLRRMSREAAGTFNHSMQVANLAADAAAKIGAKVLLVRTGAFYHDIGKMLNPAFFTENQSGVNPHNQLSPEASARIIISHVTEGMKLADKYHLPKAVKDFIPTHHGKSKAKYFYITWLNSHPGETPPEDVFTYPGPNPYTREQAILMMADSVEASSRSLKEYTEASITELVNRIIDTQVKEGYFLNCPITFRDISDIKHVFIDCLKTIYHSRIQYPEFNNASDKTHPTRQRNLGGLFGKYRL